ncbi:MAG TPA: tetraacyldisaccharide 4'-kinase [Flavobacteriales bacterium]
MLLLRRLLLPLAWIYGAVLRLRHALYDSGTFSSTTPAPPTIVVGNIALGGTGKTPHVELVLRTLIEERPLATLSRGYGRKGTDLIEVDRGSDPELVGDEPLMLKRKLSGVHVFVGADRVAGVRTIAEKLPDVKAVVLDDALQHRRLKAGLNLVLTTFHRPWYKDALLPAGNLRDIPHRARQADAVIVTKCPQLPTTDEQARWRERLGLRSGVPLFFSGLEYAPPCSVYDTTAVVPTGAGTSALLFTGIADADPLVHHARSLFGTVKHMAFPDHHAFSPSDQARLARLFDTFATGERTLLTTAKDAARLGTALISGPLEDLPLAVIDVQARILNEPHSFTALIRSHVATHPAHR